MSRIFVVDAFADAPFSGNPAGVCVLAEERDEHWMQEVAAEMKHSETAFVRPLDGPMGLRWFTPAVEVELCGHATLATAHVLWSEGYSGDVLVFSTLSGELRATREGSTIVLDLPSFETLPISVPERLVDTIGVEAKAVGRCRNDWLVEIDSWQAVSAIRPDFSKIAGLDVRGVIVTAQGGERSDFTSRFFAPSVGVDEDPVTGAAHCALGPYWSERLGRTRLVGYQASRRGGFVGVDVVGDRVHLSGSAVTVLSGTIV